MQLFHVLFICRSPQAQLVEQGARSHAEASEEYFHAEREYTRSQHYVEEIEVRLKP